MFDLNLASDPNAVPPMRGTFEKQAIRLRHATNALRQRLQRPVLISGKLNRAHCAALGGERS